MLRHDDVAEDDPGEARAGSLQNFEEKIAGSGGAQELKPSKATEGDEFIVQTIVGKRIVKVCSLFSLFLIHLLSEKSAIQSSVGRIFCRRRLLAGPGMYEL